MENLSSEKENIQKNQMESLELKITVSKMQNPNLTTDWRLQEKSKWTWRLSNRNYLFLRTEKDKDLAEMETQWYVGQY